MTARVLALLVPFAIATAAQGQSAQPVQTARFEVASVRPSPPSDTPTAGVSVRITPAQVGITSLTMEDLLAFAFNVSGKQIAGPDWIQEARFDVTAKLPAGASRDDVPAMLEDLLRERFQLKIRREPRESPVYALTLARNGRPLTPSPLKETEPENIEVTGAAATTA
jgi:uncharacterized protein (TIGR03435 family)